MSKLLGASLVAHVIFCFAAVYIPGVRDALNLAALISDTNFVDRPYQRTIIDDNVEFVELPREKFHYPEGYWAVEGSATPEPTPLPFLAQMLNPPKPLPVNPEMVVAPSPIASPTPTPTPGTGDSSSTAKSTSSPAQGVAQSNANTSASPAPSPTSPLDKAQSELEKAAADNNVKLPAENEINKQVMRDFAAYANELKQQGKLDLNKPFEIIIEADLDENGKLKDPKFTKKAGDPNLVDLFGRMVAALNDSGFLTYLKSNDKTDFGNIVFTIKQGETEVLATVECETPSVEMARKRAGGFNLMLLAGAQTRAGKDEEVLLRNTSAEPVGKKVVFNFTMPRQAVVDLIKKQLANNKPG